MNQVGCISDFSPIAPSSNAKWVRLKGLRVCSLFAGAGGLDLGFINAGHKVVWSNDIDRDSVNTYQKNIGSHISCCDISSVDPSALPSFDVLIGGFPCQGFSRANVHRIKRDERNKLYEHIIIFLKNRRPRFFILENVRGILSINGGRTIRKIFNELSSVGYQVDYRILNAADFGVPQNRVRVFICGTRLEDVDKFRFVFPEPTHSQKKEPGKKAWVSVGKFLSKLPEPTELHSLKNHVCSQYKITNRDYTGHRRTDPKKPSPTILARGNGGGGVCAIQHPKNHRRLSVRESAMIQTFPKNFEFVGSLNSMYRQVGNAVPVRLASCIASGFQKRAK